MSKVYLIPLDTLDREQLRKTFKKAKADARGTNGKDMQKVSEDETPK